MYLQCNINVISMYCTNAKSMYRVNTKVASDIYITNTLHIHCTYIANTWFGKLHCTYIANTLVSTLQIHCKYIADTWFWQYHFTSATLFTNQYNYYYKANNEFYKYSIYSIIISAVMFLSSKRSSPYKYIRRRIYNRHNTSVCNGIPSGVIHVSCRSIHYIPTLPLNELLLLFSD